MTQRHEQYGLAAHLCARSRIKRDLGHFNDWVMPAILHEQIMFAFAWDGQPVGFWAWAFLAPDAARRLRRDGSAGLHESEWNEGGELWILELAAPGGHLRDLLSFIRRSANFGHDSVTLRRQTCERGSPPRLSACSSKPDDYDSWARTGHVLRLPRGAFAPSHSRWKDHAGRSESQGVPTRSTE